MPHHSTSSKIKSLGSAYNLCKTALSSVLVSRSARVFNFRKRPQVLPYKRSSYLNNLPRKSMGCGMLGDHLKGLQATAGFFKIVLAGNSVNLKDVDRASHSIYQSEQGNREDGLMPRGPNKQIPDRNDLTVLGQASHLPKNSSCPQASGLSRISKDTKQADFGIISNDQAVQRYAPTR